MMFSSERREIMHAQLMLPIYGQLVDSNSSNLELEEAQLTYANKEAQNYLRKVTEPCFAHLKCLYERLKKDELDEMRQNRDKATRTYKRLEGLEQSRAEIPRDNHEALEVIELKIEDCLKGIAEAAQNLADSTFRVRQDLADMRERLEVYGELLQYLEKTEKTQYYRRIIAKFEEECNACQEHTIYELDVEQKRSALLENLREKRWREQRSYNPTRADMLEALHMGW